MLERWVAASLVLAVGIIVHFAEDRKPLTSVNRRRHLLFDFLFIGAAVLLVAGITELFLTEAIQRPFEALGLGALVTEVPMFARILFALIVGDLGYYIIHRSMHHPWLWNAHRFHHSTQEIWWFSGQRTSVLNSLFIRIGYLAGFHIFEVTPTGMIVTATLLLAVNFWVHANLDVSLGPLNRIFVTPRFHRVHHAMVERAEGRNFGNILSVWDYLFGTALAPDAELDDAEKGFEVGGGEAVRQLIGV